MISLIRFIFKSIFTVLLVFVLGIGACIAYDSYTSSNTVKNTGNQDTQIEDQLTTVERLNRLVHVREAVADAMNRKVPHEDQVKSSNISDFTKKALVAAEDKRFYEHGAIDMYGIVRAFYTNTVAGKTVEGGSTITQQLVKNLFLTSQRTMSRKIEEVILAFLVEHEYSKDEILTMYLNSVYYGNDYYGLKAASRGYFDTTPARLSLAQSAMLAGLHQAPTYYNPKENYKAAKQRQYTVLMQMVQQDMISASEAESAIQDPLGLADEPDFDPAWIEGNQGLSLDDIFKAVKQDSGGEEESSNKKEDAGSKSSSKSSASGDATSNDSKRGDRSHGYIGD